MIIEYFEERYLKHVFILNTLYINIIRLNVYCFLKKVCVIILKAQMLFDIGNFKKPEYFSKA